MKDRCYIFAWGNDFFPARFKYHALPEKNDFVIAADSGCEIMRAFGLAPDVIMGDMDSFGEERAKEMFPDAKIIVLPPEKDFTDSKLCLDYAIDNGYDDVIIVGGLGGRLDHTLANVNLLRYAFKRGISLEISDGTNRAFYIKDSALKVEQSPFFKYLSIIPFSDVLTGVNMLGVKYPLENATVRRDDAITVSNEITSKEAEIRVLSGECLIIESVD